MPQAYTIVMKRIADGGLARQTYEGLCEVWEQAGRPTTNIWYWRWTGVAEELLDAAREVQAAGYALLAASLLDRHHDAVQKAAECR